VLPGRSQVGGIDAGVELRARGPQLGFRQQPALEQADQEPVRPVLHAPPGFAVEQRLNFRAGLVRRRETGLRQLLAQFAVLYGESSTESADKDASGERAFFCRRSSRVFRNPLVTANNNAATHRRHGRTNNRANATGKTTIAAAPLPKIIAFVRRAT
jgi:hypothetical protein